MNCKIYDITPLGFDDKTVNYDTYLYFKKFEKPIKPYYVCDELTIRFKEYTTMNRKPKIITN